MKYSVVIPVYRSANLVAGLYERLSAVMNALDISWELVLVEDCGGDDTFEKILALKSELGDRDNILALQLGRNFGQHNAIWCGVQHASGERIITIDDDLQNPPEEIPKLIEEMERSGCDLVYGVPHQKKHSKFRNLGSDLIQRTVRVAFGNTGNISSFRLFKRFLIENSEQMQSRFVFLEGILMSSSSYVRHLPVRHAPREQGRSGYSIAKLIRLSLNLLLNYTTLPLRVIVYSGLSIAALSFALGLWFVVRKFAYDVPMGFSALIVSIFFSLGILLIVLGVIGEYIGRIYEFTLKRPAYSVRVKAEAKRKATTTNEMQA